MGDENKLTIVILRVKDKYIKSNDKQLKRIIGKIMAGDISINNGK